MSEQYKEEYFDRPDDYENVDSNSYIATMYTQLSVFSGAAGGLILPVVEQEF